MEETKQPEIPTEEQIAEFEVKMKMHYEKKLPFLRLKAEYDGLHADIAEARIRSLQANNQFAEAMAQYTKAAEPPVEKKEGI